MLKYKRKINIIATSIKGLFNNDNTQLGDFSFPPHHPILIWGAPILPSLHCFYLHTYECPYNLFTIYNRLFS